jgi:hypothetical protein
LIFNYLKFESGESILRSILLKDFIILKLKFIYFYILLKEHERLQRSRSLTSIDFIGSSKNSFIHSPLHSLKFKLKRSASSIGVADKRRHISRLSSKQKQRPSTTLAQPNKQLAISLPSTPLAFRSQSRLSSKPITPIAQQLSNRPTSTPLSIDTRFIPNPSSSSSKFILEQINEEDEENVQEEENYETVYVNINRNRQQTEKFYNDDEEENPKIYFSKKILKKVIFTF